MASGKTWYAVQVSEKVLAHAKYPWAAFVASVNSHGHGSRDAKAIPTRIVLDADRTTFYTTDERSYRALLDVPGLDDLGTVDSPYGSKGDPDDDGDDTSDEPAAPGEGE